MNTQITCNVYLLVDGFLSSKVMRCCLTIKYIIPFITFSNTKDKFIYFEIAIWNIISLTPSLRSIKVWKNCYQKVYKELSIYNFYLIDVTKWLKEIASIVLWKICWAEDIRPCGHHIDVPSYLIKMLACVVIKALHCTPRSNNNDHTLVLILDW